MQIDIKVIDDVEDSSSSLVAWLHDDDDLGSAMINEVVASVPDEMGPNTDLVQVFAEPEVVVAIIGAVAAWIATRNKVVKVRLKRGNKEVEIEGSADDDPARMAEELMKSLN